GRTSHSRFEALGVALAAGTAVAVLTMLQPVLVDPLFVSTRPLPATAAAQAAALERKMDAHPRSITVGDAASRTTAENAEVDGLGPTVRVVVDDTALAEPPAEMRALLGGEADWVGLRATRDPAGMESLDRRLALSALSNPTPPAWAVWLLFDHPPVMDRIAVARGYASSSSP